MANYWKEQLTNRFNINGAPVPWVPMSGNAGYITVQDGSPMDQELGKVVGKLGVTKISEEELAEKKISRKLVPSRSSRFGKGFSNPVRVVPRQDDLFKNLAKAAPAAEEPAKPEPAKPSDQPVASAPKLGKIKVQQ